MNTQHSTTHRISFNARRAIVLVALAATAGLASGCHYHSGKSKVYVASGYGGYSHSSSTTYVKTYKTTTPVYVTKNVYRDVDHHDHGKSARCDRHDHGGKGRAAPAPSPAPGGRHDNGLHLGHSKSGNPGRGRGSDNGLHLGHSKSGNPGRANGNANGRGNANGNSNGNNGRRVGPRDDVPRGGNRNRN